MKLTTKRYVYVKHGRSRRALAVGSISLTKPTEGNDDDVEDVASLTVLEVSLPVVPEGYLRASVAWEWVIVVAFGGSARRDLPCLT